MEKSELEEEGQQRRLSLVGGGIIIERLENVDEDSRTYSYTIADSPLPLTNYKRTIKVTGEGENCNVEWSSEFAGASDGDAMEAVRGIYQALSIICKRCSAVIKRIRDRTKKRR